MREREREREMVSSDWREVEECSGGGKGTARGRAEAEGARRYP
jgi:hypothetical protein